MSGSDIFYRSSGFQHMLKPRVISFMFSLALIGPLSAHANVFNNYWPQLFSRTQSERLSGAEPPRLPPETASVANRFTHNVKHGLPSLTVRHAESAKKPRLSKRPAGDIPWRSVRVVNANNRPPANLAKTPALTETAVAQALKEVDTLNTTVRLDKTDSLSSDPVVSLKPVNLSKPLPA